jgi:hypothetical protein
MKRETKSVYAELVQALKDETLQPGDITIEQLMRDTGAKDERARRLLESRVRAGELRKFRICHNGVRISVYRATANR